MALRRGGRACGAAQHFGRAVERAAAQDARAAAGGILAAVVGAVRIAAIHAARPFPHVARHVQRAERAGGLRVVQPDGRRAVVDFVEIVPLLLRFGFDVTDSNLLFVCVWYCDNFLLRN